MIFSKLQLVAALLLVRICLSYPLATTTSSASAGKQQTSVPELAGKWVQAREDLRHPDCCVVTVMGLTSHLKVLQRSIADNGPADLDLRSRIRGAHVEEDCRRLQFSILGINLDSNNDEDNCCQATTAALVEIVRGAASMADGISLKQASDVFVRIVCAADYKARDPMFHTDKCPMRGYVTLRGVGTEFCTNICNPIEYATLRGLGTTMPFGNKNDNLRQAKELEFIVMKGDHYHKAPAKESIASSSSSSSSWSWWTRASACVHRSPPGKGGKRVILSFDLAAGEDNREWFQINRRREWRSGMTQRKSRLVA